MDQDQICALLCSQNIAYERTEHKAVFNMAEAAQLSLPHPEAEAKNLFVRDEKKRNYYMITIKGNKRVDLKAFRQAQGIRPLSFASEEDLMELLGLIPGAVTPLGLLNDAQKRVKLFLDQSFLDPPGLIGVHPNDNTATLWLKAEDLIRFLREQGCDTQLFSL